MDRQSAFNLGSDARLRGARIRHCPLSIEEGRRHWMDGWKDVNDYWGTEARNRWRCRLLPELKW